MYIEKHWIKHAPDYERKEQNNVAQRKGERHGRIKE